MALQKQAIPINFSQGVDKKTDPYQVQIGKFLTLVNSVFDTSGRLTKRAGFATRTTLPNTIQTTLTTLNDNLIATGSDLYAFSEDTDEWLNQGSIQPVSLDVQSMVKNSASQTSQDAGVASNGLACITYIESGALYYNVIDSNTGQQIVAKTLIVNGVASPRCFVLGRYFIITYIATIAAATHLQYIAVPIAVPGSPLAPQDISNTLPSTTAGYDAFVANNNIYVAWTETGPAINVTYISSTLIQQAPAVYAGQTANLMSVTADITGSTAVVWVSWYDDVSNNGYTLAVDHFLQPVLAPAPIIVGEDVASITSAAQNMINSIFYETNNTYAPPYPTPGVRTDYINSLQVTQGGSVSGTDIILRSVGLGSKAFIGPEEVIYMIAAYGEANQPTYFLIDSLGAIYMRLAYANGGGYVTNQVLPTITSIGDGFEFPYLVKDFLTTTNKGTALPAGSPVNAIYTQTGINLASFSINTSGQYSSEIANTLHLTGGQLWMYDAVKPVEHGFHVWPENVKSTTSGAGGAITAGTYNYVFTYEWTDNQGNIHRSAPSIPLTQVTVGATSTNTLYVPTLRLTYKTTPNAVRIVGYRWSVAQQVYYQFTSITSPTLNDPSVDYVTITDTFSDLQILGNPILYTNGGVIENIMAPAVKATALFKNRLWLIDAEDPNLLWFSKVVIEGTPVEMSDLLTLFVAPTSGAQGSTGDVTALSAMDDKLIIFKRDAIYYVTGTGPDNTGANNDFTDPIFITSSVGCDNPNSIVLMPMGLMFQSDKGIWLLGRDLSTKYIGADVESYNSQIVKSAQIIPGTNQVRFILDDMSTTLMYDYFYQQWGTFSNIRAISATLWQGAHTYLNEFGRVFQETPNTYVDGSSPVLMSFTTSWINVAGLQGYERFYEMLLLGTYITPYKLNVQLAYDYGFSQQSIIVQPDNFTPPWGGDAVWGSGQAWGGPGNVFEARVFPETQKCESFQVSVQEVYDASFGVAAGAGLTLSGLNLVVGMKKGYRVQKSSRTFG